MIKLDTESLRHYETNDSDEEISVDYPQALVSEIPSLVTKNGGELYTMAIASEPGVVVFKRCNSVQYSKLSAAYLEDNKSLAVNVAKTIGFDCVVWPSLSVFTGIADRYPGIPIAIGNLAFGESTGRRVATKKKG